MSFPAMNRYFLVPGFHWLDFGVLCFCGQKITGQKDFGGGHFLTGRVPGDIWRVKFLKSTARLRCVQVSLAVCFGLLTGNEALEWGTGPETPSAPLMRLSECPEL